MTVGIIGVWFAMMCWEVYDLHPDHMILYSVLYLGPLVWSVNRTRQNVR